MSIKNKIENFKKPLEVIANKFEGFIVSFRYIYVILWQI
jgi:hypothetical protein